MENTNLNPTVYPDQYEGTEEEIADKIINSLPKIKKPDQMDLFEKLTDLNYLLNNVYIGANKNTEDDLFVNSDELEIIEYFYIDLKLDAENSGSIKISNSLLTKIANYNKKSELEIINLLKEYAQINTEKEMVFTTMYHMMTEIMGTEAIDMIPFEEEAKLYVLTNKKKYRGAGAIFCLGVLDDIAEKLDTDYYYIIPSSIHELLIVNDKSMDKNELKSIIEEVNNTKVVPEERLSYNLYKYDACTGTVTISD